MSLNAVARKLRIRNSYVREAFAEFLGTFVLVSFGDASVAQSVLSNTTGGTFLSINLGWGLAVMMAIFVSGGISGGHVNPAVSVALATCGKFPWRKVPIYMVSQYLGAFVASASIFLVYRNALTEFGGGEFKIDTAGIWATYPKDFLSVGNGFADQVMGTALLVSGVMAITDSKNMKTPKGVVPLMIGMLVAAIGMCYGFNCGYAINPARDLAPRFFTFIAGWGTQVFSFRDYNWWWVPVVAPHVGGVLGAWVYRIFIEAHWPEDEDDNLIVPVEIVEVRKMEKH